MSSIHPTHTFGDTPYCSGCGFNRNSDVCKQPCGEFQPPVAVPPPSQPVAPAIPHAWSVPQSAVIIGPNDEKKPIRDIPQWAIKEAFKRVGVSHNWEHTTPTIDAIRTLAGMIAKHETQPISAVLKRARMIFSQHAMYPPAPGSDPACYDDQPVMKAIMQALKEQPPRDD